MQSVAWKLKTQMQEIKDEWMFKFDTLHIGLLA